MPGWAELVASGKQDVVEKRISDLNQLRSVYRMLILDSEEEIESNTVPLSGIEGVLAKLEKRVVQASGMPHTIVLGEGSQGSTSGRTETEDWAATVAEAQNSYLKPKLEMVAKAIMSQTNAPAMEQDSNGLFEIHFKPVITKRDSEKVAEYKTTAEADSIYASLGVISPEDIRNRFSQDGFRYDIQLEEIDEELIEAELPEPQENLDSVEAFIPPNDVATAASKGLAMRKQYGRGGTEIGVARARDLKNQKQISLETIARMVSFFARHEQNKKSTTESGEPGNGMIAWELWGGDAGKQWAEGIWKRTQEKGDQSDIQTLVFSKGRFKSKEQVIEWIRENGFKQIKEIDETESSWRVRQVAPADFKASSFRTVDITEGVKAVIGELQNY